MTTIKDAVTDGPGSLGATDLWCDGHSNCAGAGEVLTEMAEYVKGVGRADDEEEAKVGIDFPAFHAMVADQQYTCCLQGPCKWHVRLMLTSPSDHDPKYLHRLLTRSLLSRKLLT